MKAKILRGKGTRELLKEMKNHYDIDVKPDVVFVSSGKGKIWIINKNINKIETSKLNIERYGTYVMFSDKYGIRFTIEGSQIFGKFAKKNVFEIGKKQVQNWIRGFDLEIKTETNRYVIIKCGNDYLGCGKGAIDRIQNYIPKSRRIIKL